MSVIQILTLLCLTIAMVGASCPQEGYKMTGFCSTFDDNGEIVLIKAPCFQKCLDYGTNLTTFQKISIVFSIIGFFFMIFLAYWYISN